MYGVGLGGGKNTLQEHESDLGRREGLFDLPVVQVVLEVAVSNPKLQILHKLHTHRRKSNKKSQQTTPKRLNHSTTTALPMVATTHLRVFHDIQSVEDVKTCVSRANESVLNQVQDVNTVGDVVVAEGGPELLVLVVPDDGAGQGVE